MWGEEPGEYPGNSPQLTNYYGLATDQRRKKMANLQQQLLPVQQVAIECLEKIGSGSFGVVYKAKIGSEIYAVKQLQNQFENCTLDCKRFQQECFIMSQVKHDSIVKCRGLVHHGQPILIMELMDCNLRQFLRDSKPYLYMQVDITASIFQAISYLHQQGIWHRDLSSANILMKNGVAKVTDFGMARLLDLTSAVNPSNLTRCPGTKAYMPPEALQEAPDYNEKIDIFSIGVLIIEILTRKVPKPDKQFELVNYPTSVFRKEFERRADHIALCDDDNPLKHAALCCLQDDKNRRPSAEECCVAVVQIQQSHKYKEDRELAELGMQLVAHNDAQKIAKEITLLQNSKDLGVIQIQALQVEVASLQQEKESDRKTIQDLHVRVSDLKSQLTINMQEIQQEMQQKHEKSMEENNQRVRQQVEEYIHKCHVENEQRLCEETQKCREETQKCREETQKWREETQKWREETQRVQVEKEQLEQSLSSMSSSLKLSRMSQHEVELDFVKGTDVPRDRAMHRWSSAVVLDEAIYVIPGRTEEIWKFFNDSWSDYSKCKAMNSTLAVVEGKLVTIGGHSYSKNENNEIVIDYHRNLYTLLDGNWKTDYLPSMQDARDSVIAITKGKALIVAGGCAEALASGGKRSIYIGIPLTVVEVLCIDTKQWQYVSSLPHPLCHASITTFGDKLYILGPRAPKGLNSLLTCKLIDLCLSNEKPSIWTVHNNFPALNSTCVTFNGHLLAIGGLSTDHIPSGTDGTSSADHVPREANYVPSNKVYCFDEDTNAWNIVGNLLVPRNRCFAVVLSKQLFVIGGKDVFSVEIGTSTVSL